MKINKKFFIILALCLCASSKKSRANPNATDHNDVEYEYTDHESTNDADQEVLNSSPPAPVSPYDDYESFKKNVDADQEFVKGYLHNFVTNSENRDFGQVHNILKFLQVGLARPQKEDGSYYGMLSKFSKFFTKKNDTDRFYDLFKVNEKDRYTWVSNALREFHSFKRTPALLAELDQKVQNGGALTNEAVLEIIKEYKEIVQEYNASKEKLTKMFSSVISSPIEAPFPPAKLSFLGCSSMEKLDFYEDLFTTVGIVDQGTDKIKTPSLEQSSDPCVYFSTVIGIANGLKTTSKNYFSAENPFLKAISQQQQQSFKDKIAQSVRFVGESVAKEIQQYFNA